MKDFFALLGASWNGFIASLDTSGGHLLVFISLYVGMCFAHCSEQDRNAVFQALLLVLRPGGSK